MDIEDLRLFLVIARFNNLQKAAIETHKTAGALSKVVKRLEVKLNSEIFDRRGRNIVLNQRGERFRQYALHMVHESDQMLSEFGQLKDKTQVNISGPSVLVQYYLPELLKQLSSEAFDLNLNVAWEGHALNQVEHGAAHLALATQFAALERGTSNELKSIALAETEFKVVADRNHGIFSDFPDGRILSEELLSYGFACPNVSPFCGIKRGIGSDGWHDDVMPRNIAFRCDDFNLLILLVKQGAALAYVPDFIAKQHHLAIVEVIDNTHINKEIIELFYQPSKSSGWLNHLIASIATEST